MEAGVIGSRVRYRSTSALPSHYQSRTAHRVRAHHRGAHPPVSEKSHPKEWDFFLVGLMRCRQHCNPTQSHRTRLNGAPSSCLGQPPPGLCRPPACKPSRRSVVEGQIAESGSTGHRHSKAAESYRHDGQENKNRPPRIPMRESEGDWCQNH
jgi:hypothetical protein